MSVEHTKNWPDLAIGLYDRLTGSNAEIRYDFEDLKVRIPSGTGPEAEHAEWTFNGGIRISTGEKGTSPKS